MKLVKIEILIEKERKYIDMFVVKEERNICDINLWIIIAIVVIWLVILSCVSSIVFPLLVLIILLHIKSDFYGRKFFPLISKMIVAHLYEIQILVWSKAFDGIEMLLRKYL